MTRQNDTADRLRADIDSGRTGDKVDFVDPAAAPLGTDDEAAGSPPTAVEVGRARAQEVRNRPADRTMARRSREGRHFGGPNVQWVLPLVAVVVIGLVVAIVALA